jgi:NADH:ubiquinone oxidoreductase subunit
MASDAHDFRWKDFLLEIFAWWRGNTWGTRLWVATRGVYVGSDEVGNRYYRSRPGSKPGPNGYERRMVVYAGGNAEASTIPPGWHGWMHYRTDVPPIEEAYEPHVWQKPHLSNLTGTAYAYRPDGSLLSKGERPRVTGDYDAWSPE